MPETVIEHSAIKAELLAPSEATKPAATQAAEASSQATKTSKSAPQAAKSTEATAAKPANAAKAPLPADTKAALTGCGKALLRSLNLVGRCGEARNSISRKICRT
ncbi:MAG: hypothetical protein NZM31_10815 [Gemmatales bacterium]|nr:hypothetical protein [Gemmatales bacterium]MDW8387488.1 hypothetical protein [Gemmatales bacterium]